MKRYPVFITLLLLTACSQGASITQTGTDAGAPPSAAPQPSARPDRNTPFSPCDAIAAADVAGILTAQATSKPGAAPASCMYQTQSKANVTISLAKGDEEKGAWMLATTYSATKKPLAGIGDEALYNAEGTTLVARKGDTSCRVDVMGYDNADAMDDITRDRGVALASKLGALCNKFFASR